MMTLDVQPHQGPLDAFVYGWDPASPLSALDREAILHALQEHLVLVFRGQAYIADEDLISLAGQLGELLRGSAFLASAREHPEIPHVGNLESEDDKPRTWSRDSTKTRMLIPRTACSGRLAAVARQWCLLTSCHIEFWRAALGCDCLILRWRC